MKLYIGGIVEFIFLIYVYKLYQIKTMLNKYKVYQKVNFTEAKLIISKRKELSVLKKYILYIAVLGQGGLLLPQFGFNLVIAVDLYTNMFENKFYVGLLLCELE